MGTIVTRPPGSPATEPAARPRPARQNVDEAIIVRWRDGMAVVELVSTVRRKHRRRAVEPEPATAHDAGNGAGPPSAGPDGHSQPPEEVER